MRLFQPISFIWLHAEPILLALKQDPEVARLAAVYLSWSALGLPGSSFAPPCFEWGSHDFSK